MNLSIDLSDLDTKTVSWSGSGDEAAGLYTLPTASGIALTEQSGGGKGGCSGGPCCQGRPIQWCCVNCH